jgi:hypothetical protein
MNFSDDIDMIDWGAGSNLWESHISKKTLPPPIEQFFSGYRDTKGEPDKELILNQTITFCGIDIIIQTKSLLLQS